MIRTLFAAGLAALLSTGTLALEASKFTDLSSLMSVSSSWQNQSGSTMTINVDTSGNVTGQYINRAAGTGCQNSVYPLVGRVTGNYIAFSVAWNNATENCNSVTGWAGYAQVNGTNIEIVTNWNLAYQNGSNSAIEQGSDTFTYANQVVTSNFLKK